MAKKLKSLRCPTCRKIVLKADPEFPFCSERCREVDLGKWASGGYVISSPINDPEAIERVMDYHEQRSRKKKEEDELGDDTIGGRVN